MKLKHVLFGVTFLMSNVMLGQTPKEVLLTIEGQDITVDEFMAIYNKNNVEIESADKKSVEEYLELYLNFKLKVHDAEVQGYDTVPTFVNELEGYIDQLASPYLVDNQFTEELINEAYERLQYEIKASHILVKIPDNPSPQDTLEAWNKVNRILKIAKTDTNFTKLAKANSDDPSVKENGGDLGYFSAFRMVYPFESMAYNTPVGKISNPVRTSYGYHILKIEDKIPSRGEIKAAHIMIISNEKSTPEEVKKAKKKISEIYAELQAGESFSKLANTYSDDRGSAQKGGDLGWFGPGRMVPSFEKVAYSIPEKGNYSEPFLTQFGWHIILLEDKKNVGTYEEEYDELSKKVKGDRRSLGSEHALVLKLMDDYKVKIKEKSKVAFYDVLDSSYFKNDWDSKIGSNLNRPLIIINDKKYKGNKEVITQADFTEFLDRRMKNQKPMSIPLFVDQEFEKFVDYSIINYEKSVLKLKYPEYKALVTEYHDGILLFEIMEDEVWKKAMKDSTGLANFYDSTKENYMWKDRLEAKLYICNSQENADLVMSLVSEGIADSTIESKINTNSELGLTIREGKFEKGQEKMLDEVAWKKGVSIQSTNGSFVVVNVSNVLASQPKELSEVKGLVTSAYQDELDKRWIIELRNKYSYSVNKEVLNIE
ncbi:MAG: peptidylprolyl isomerase [Salibacteraceae bacterium]